MKRNHLCIVIVLLLSCCWGCDGKSADIPERPASERETDVEYEDNSMRISGPMLTLRYDDGGILFSRSRSGVISAVRLSDDISFEYDPTVPSLTIAGTDIALSSVEIVDDDNGCEWHKLTTSSGNETVYIVINGL